MTEDNGQMILEETLDENFVPTTEELEACATMLGIDLDKEPYLEKLVQECLTTPLPETWRACADQQGNLYYFNVITGDSSWEHPCDSLYRRLAVEERQRFSSEKTAPDGPETDSVELISSSAQEIATETSLHTESSGLPNPFDNRPKGDSTGYHTVSEDVWSSVYEAAHGEIYHSPEESKIKSYVGQKVAGEESGMRAINFTEDPDSNNVENLAWTLESSKPTKAANYDHKTEEIPPTAINSRGTHLLLEMGDSDKRPGANRVIKFEKPNLAEDFECCPSKISMDNSCSHLVVEQAGKRTDLCMTLLHCERKDNSSDFMREFGEADETRERIRATIDQLLKNTHLSNSEKAKIKEIVNSLRERINSRTLLNEFKGMKTDEKVVGMSIRQSHAPYNVPSVHAAGDVRVSTVTTAKRKIRANEAKAINSERLRDRRTGSESRLRLVTEACVIYEPTSVSGGDVNNPLSKRVSVLSSNLSNSFDNRHLVDRDYTNEEGRQIADKGVFSFPQRDSQVPVTSPVTIQHDKEHSLRARHPIQRLLSDSHSSKNCLRTSQMQDSRDLEMRISNQRQWFQKYQREVASRTPVF